MDAAFWNQRYGAQEAFYGTEPNDFLKAEAGRLPRGRFLCLAEGEGRNAVFLASLGHTVHAVDQSETGLKKARELARQRGVALETHVADLSEFDLGSSAWTGIISIWAHLPSALRREVHRRVVKALEPGGFVILEAYTPAQLPLGTGGPKSEDLLMTVEALREEFAGLELCVAREVFREVQEGTGHRGRSAVVQVVGQKPA